MQYRTSPDIADADRAAAGRDIDAVSPSVVIEARRAQWESAYRLSCGHARDGLRENERGQLGCAKLNCDGLVVAKEKL